MYGLTPTEYRALPTQTRIILAASDFHGYRHPWNYNTSPRFPANPGSIPSSLVDPDRKYIDCSSLSLYCIMTAFPEAKWDAPSYAMLQTFKEYLPAQPECSQTALITMGIGTAIESPAVLRTPAWYVDRIAWPIIVIQGWRAKGPEAAYWKGHNMLAVVYPEELLILESTTKKAIDGLGWTYRRWSELKNMYPAALYCTLLND